MLDGVLNPDGLFSLYDVRGYDFLLKCVGYQVLPYRQCRLPWLSTTLTMCGLSYHTSLGYEPYTTELVLTLNQKLQLHPSYEVFFIVISL